MSGTLKSPHLPLRQQRAVCWVKLWLLSKCRYRSQDGWPILIRVGQRKQGLSKSSESLWVQAKLVSPSPVPLTHCLSVIQTVLPPPRQPHCLLDQTLQSLGSGPGLQLSVCQRSLSAGSGPCPGPEKEVRRAWNAVAKEVTREG